MTDKTDHPPLPEKFAALGVRPSILRALAELKFETPSEIQTLLIPRALAGVDLLGQARTGTGKTAAFGIPILQKVQRGLATQAIILVPTRELAVQVEAELKRFAQHTPIKVLAVYGGQKIAAQAKFLKHDPEVLVGTPGRVIDLLDRRMIGFDNLRFAVLDEVDRMLDIGFRDDIRNILSRAKDIRRRVQSSEDGEGQAAAPEQQQGGEPQGSADSGRIQTIFVSATISEEIERLARRYMKDAEKLIAPGADEKPTVSEVEQYYLSVQPWDKYRLLRKLLLQENPDLAIVFTKTKHGAQKLAKKLHADGIECREIHGNLAQNKRDRVMKNFRTGKFDVLVATDLASRGIDVQDITHIINYDIPDDPEVYVHRVGRTARMGAKGRAFTFVQRDQGELLTKVENLINMIVPQGAIEGFEASPPPADWIDAGAFTSSEPAKPIVSRFQRAYAGVPVSTTPPGEGDAAAEASAPVPIKPPVRTIGSKIPINRRKGRRR